MIYYRSSFLEGRINPTGYWLIDRGPRYLRFKVLIRHDTKVTRLIEVNVDCRDTWPGLTDWKTSEASTAPHVLLINTTTCWLSLINSEIGYFLTICSCLSVHGQECASPYGPISFKPYEMYFSRLFRHSQLLCNVNDFKTTK